MLSEFERYLIDNNIDTNPKNFPYTHPIYFNENRLFDCLDDIIENDRKVMIFGDCDPDGVLSACQCKDTLSRFGHKNFKVWNYKTKKHNIDEDCIYECIEEKYDYIIILDVGTNELENINRLVTFGVKVIIIDHHVGKYSFDVYPEGCVLINSKMNNRVDERFLYVLSAGALTFTLLYKYGSLRNMDLSSLSIHALITLYSDSVDMSRSLNKSIYNLAINQPLSAYPYFVVDFLGKTSFRRRFIEFSLVPKINSLFRAEEFGLINSYFFDDTVTSFMRSRILDQINYVYIEKRKMVNRVTDIIDREVLSNFVIANLSKSRVAVENSKLYNYTGIIANNLAQEYNKPCIVLCDTGEEIKGSFRDLLGRNYLEIFSQFCRCGGHPPAFGIHLSYMEVSDFLYMIKNTVDKKFSIYGLRENLVIDMEDPAPNRKVLDKIAQYNEFSGGELPLALIKKRHLMGELSTYNVDYYRYTWGDMEVTSSHKLVKGAYIQIKPVFAKNLKLITYNRGC